MASEHDQGTAAPQDNSSPLDPRIVKQLAAVRSHLRESFGNIVMSMVVTPRYRNLTVADLQQFVLEPLLADRVAIAYPRDTDDAKLSDVAGIAIWASVSDEVEARIREQIASAVFPVRLKPEDWTSGDNHWLFDVIAPDRKATATVIANFRQLVKGGNLKLHPLVARLVEPETLEKLGAQKIGGADLKGNAPPSTALN